MKHSWKCDKWRPGETCLHVDQDEIYFCGVYTVYIYQQIREEC